MPSLAQERRMLGYESLVERARRALDIVSQIEAAAERAPNDRALRVNLAAARKFARQAEEQIHNFVQPDIGVTDDKGKQA